MRTLGHINEITDPGSKGFKFSDQSFFAVRLHGKVYVYRNRCPHLGIELNWQEDQFLDYDNSLIQCATHGALFIIENGSCVAGPCVGKTLEAVPFTINNGVLTLTEQNPE
ncbi:MAG: Rieske 2Fe-2S domain-containing protein [Zhongshania sp.]|uniref:Rieske (2Fe-2S) protein n=1 Tax=Zhongshania sp. TaxID=1971902 RepID=UPI00261FA127|nr:Rieske 2Fe-2S domain-containing protein [Zhongshania sp.]MDF1691215.1 Rieske 2Fe-2S domain-containing protein [Zhongshania sp.]